MKTILCSLTFLLLVFSSTAQTPIELSAYYSPTLGDIQINRDMLTYDYRLFHSFGLGLNIPLSSSLSLGFGAKYLSQGAQQELINVSPSMPEGTGESSDLIFRIHSLNFPVSLRYQFKASKKINLFAEAGLSNGIILNQELENTAIPENASPDTMRFTVDGNPIIFITPAQERFLELDLFDKYYLGFNLAFGMNYKINQQFQLFTKPILHYQFNQKVAESSFPNDPPAFRMISFGLDVGVAFLIPYEGG